MSVQIQAENFPILQAVLEHRSAKLCVPYYQERFDFDDIVVLTCGERSIFVVLKLIADGVNVMYRNGVRNQRQSN